MAEIVGTITNLSDFLSKTQVCLSVKPNDPQQQIICLEADRKYSIPAFQREVRWDDNNLKMLLYDLSRSSKFLGNIILTIKSDHTCEIIDGQQRTTVLMLIVSCIKKKFGTKISTPDLCPLRNEGFTGFQTLLEKAFDQEAITSDDWNAILKSDDYHQLPRIQKLWNTISSSELLADRHKAQGLLDNLCKSEFNIIASYSNDVNTSIQYFLDVNLKGIRLDTEDIFKGYLFSQDSRELTRSLWQKNKRDVLRLNGVTQSSEEKRYPLMKLYEHFFYCDLYLPREGDCEYSTLKFGENFYMDYPKVKVCLDTSEDNLIDELYTPCLKWAERFDRGVGYFTTGWLTYNVAGLSDFASRGGKMRLITSPILSTEDTDAIIGAENQDCSAFLRLEAALLENVEILKQEMEADIINTFSWMLYDGIIDMRFAIPCEKLEEGDFHDKFGIFYKGNDALSFSGSINDSKHGFQNYESIKVFKTWAGTQEYVDADTARFEKIWNRKDRNLKIFTIPQAVKNKIFELRSPDRPYSLPAGSSKWVHQDIAVKTFLEKEHGILAMATGTGKTVTAMKIINKLFDSGEIRRVVITMYGNDLLDQWAIQIRENYKNKQINYHYASQKMMKDFVMHPDDSILILSRDARNLSKLLDLFDRLPGDYRNDTLFVFDEVHGAGSNTFVENLSGRLSPYRYRLGLSATPEREYDEAGNDFLLNEIGEVIFEFTLQDAIQKGILCEFNYIPLPYVLSDEEKLKKRKIIAAFNAKKESGEPVDEKDMFTQLALVNKTAVNKLEEFESLISQRPELLQKCIIFVQTMEYGAKLQEILVRYSDKYHTYYADDEKINLENFAAGKIDCLLTCKKVSEGIDISSVTNIILFSSDRSRLVTTQRIGRALRLDKNNPEKKATVVDFVIEDSEENDNNADADRAEWLTELSQTRRCEHEK